MTTTETDPFAHRSHFDDGRLVETPRASVWFHDSGGDGEPLLMLGGFTAGHFVFDLARPYLDRYRLLTLEPGGLGPSRSGDGNYGAETWAEEAVAVLDELQIQQSLVWATGFGSYTAYALAALYPERVRALIAYTDVWAADETKSYAKIWAVYSTIVDNFGAQGFGARVLANVFDVSGVSWFGDWEARNIEEVLNLETVHDTVGYGCTRADVRHLLGDLRCPLAILQGAQTWEGEGISEHDDPSLALLRERRPDLGLISIEQAHPAYVLVQKPQTCAEAVMDYFDSL